MPPGMGCHNNPLHVVQFGLGGYSLAVDVPGIPARLAGVDSDTSIGCDAFISHPTERRPPSLPLEQQPAPPLAVGSALPASGPDPLAAVQPW